MAGRREISAGLLDETLTSDEGLRSDFEEMVVSADNDLSEG